MNLEKEQSSMKWKKIETGPARTEGKIENRGENKIEKRSLCLEPKCRSDCRSATEEDDSGN